jgi:acetylornithine deacetylase/succinyl-diaminopimelate desuccinylase-like protein
VTEPALAFDTGDDRYLAELVAIPTVSRDADTATMLTAAQWLADRLAFANGRGVTDDKGPVGIVLQTALAFMAADGALPLNVKFLLEGEKEIGSPHLAGYVTAHAAGLAADAAYAGMRAQDRT